MLREKVGCRSNSKIGHRFLKVSETYKKFVNSLTVYDYKP